MSDMYKEITKPNVNPLAGKCPHDCSYCYVKTFKIPSLKEKYSGELRLDRGVLSKTVKGGVRFLCSCNDLFAEDVPAKFIYEILWWASQQDCIFWIQSKNPRRMLSYREMLKRPNFVLGTTIESDLWFKEMGDAPEPKNRVVRDFLDYVTIEPVMRFEFGLIDMIMKIEPKFVNIGANSNESVILSEPSRQDLGLLISYLKTITEVRIKPNLIRLMEGDSRD